MQPTPDGLNEGQRAALRRLQRAQLAEARRIVHGDVELTHLRQDSMTLLFQVVRSWRVLPSLVDADRRGC